MRLKAAVVLGPLHAEVEALRPRGAVVEVYLAAGERFVMVDLLPARAFRQWGAGRVEVPVEHAPGGWLGMGRVLGVEWGREPRG